MRFLVPPRRPDGPGRRLVVRGLAAGVTCVLTAWACSLGAIPAILALMTAKHVLVALLLLDLGVDRPSS